MNHVGLSTIATVVAFFMVAVVEAPIPVFDGIGSVLYLLALLATELYGALERKRGSETTVGTLFAPVSSLALLLPAAAWDPGTVFLCIGLQVSILAKLGWDGFDSSVRSTTVRYAAALAVVVFVFGYETTSSVEAILLVISLVLAAVGPKLRIRHVGAAFSCGVAACLFDLRLAGLGLTAALLLAAWREEVGSRAWRDVQERFRREPALGFVGGFAATIGVGTILLSLPVSSASDASVGFLDALFTATSAVCVTGLIVLDTPHDFSLFGQCVILALFQLGGMGVLVVSSFSLMVLGSRIGRARVDGFHARLGEAGPLDVGTLVRFIVLSSLAIEAVGAAVLFVGFMGEGLPATDSAFRSVFHAVSAFCNAGFALQSASLEPFADSVLIGSTVMVLIVLGGIGFPVLASVGRRSSGVPVPIRLQRAVVVGSSVFLVLLAAVLFGMIEWDGALGGFSSGWMRGFHALFQSVTFRTAGFNTVALDGLAPVTALLAMVFMFIGGSPGGTAGGVKTTTVVVALAACRGVLRGHGRAELLGREIAADVVRKATTILLLGAFVTGLGIIALVGLHPASDPIVMTFEAVSAFGTVGLSMGGTGELGSPGKLVVIALMFLGRLGPLSVALSMVVRTPPRYALPSTSIQVG